MTWKGGGGPWTSGVVAGGFAYTESRANGPVTRGKPESVFPGKVVEQFRAFDSSGRQVPISRR